VRSTGLLAMLCLGLAGSGFASETSNPWDQLTARLTAAPLSAAALGVADCPADLLPRRPDRQVLQVVQNVLFTWEEHDLDTGTFCVVVRRPFEEVLSAENARVLLTASGAWVEELDAALGALELPAAGPAAVPRALPSAVGAVDAGVVGRASGDAAPPAPDEEGGEAVRRVLPLPSPDLVNRPGGSVIGPRDERALVSATGAFPFRVIAFLNGTLEGGVYRATGFLVGPHMVLTNAHVVWDERADRFVTSMEIRPGSAAAAPRPAVRFATNASYVATRKIEFDYGAAFFDTPFPGISTFMPLVFDANPAAGSQVTVAGFPERVRGALTTAMWADTDVVTAVQGGVLRYKVDTSGGNSGSPVGRAAAGGQVQAIAVHSNGDPVNDANSGVLFTSRNFDLIAEWLAWRPQTATGLNLTVNQVDPSGCPLVRAVVAVTNNGGRPVVDLNRLNFAVTENGVPQSVSIEPGQVSNVPVSVALVLDGSTSLSETDLVNVRAAARAFVDLLGPRDKVSVYHFSSTVRRVLGYTSDKVLAKNAINGLTRDGNTALYDAIIEAADDSRLVSGRRAIVALTDGMNNTGTLDERVPVAAARAAGVPVFTIGFGSVDANVLDFIATETGGRFFRGATSADLQAILGAIGRSIDNQYLLTWVTSFVSGGTNRVEMRVAEGRDSDQEAFSYSQAGTAGCPQPPATCQARVLRPNGGETLTKGARQTLTWNTSGPSCGPMVGLGISDGTEIWPLGDFGDDGNQPVNVDFLPGGSRYKALVVDRATGANDASDSTFSIANPAQTVPCRADAQTLCLRQNRFRVKVLWRGELGGGGFARAVPITGESGYFWFTEAASAELAVKLLDGRAVNAHFWFFSGTLTNVDYAIFVTDTQTGEGRVYSNTVGDFASFADLTAFGPPTEESAAAFPPLAAAPAAEPIAEPLPASANVLWNQIDRGSNNVTSSENRLDPGGAPFVTEGADDFVVPAGARWAVDGVDVQGAYFGNGPRGPAGSVNVFVYGDQANLPAALLCTYRRVRPVSGLATGSFTLDLPQPCSLASGRYWVAVQANMDFPAAGQWGWRDRTAARERTSVWRNPGGGYNTACDANFGRRVQTCRIGDQPDFVFRLRGTTGTAGTASCRANSTTLCLIGQRFKVEVSTPRPNGQPAAAPLLPLTANVGYTWLQANRVPDLLIKIVDGRTINNAFWVFYGSLTDAAYTLTVTDTLTGRVKTYTNRRGNFVSAADTLAFPGN
jgi:VWFA-related protein